MKKPLKILFDVFDPVVGDCKTDMQDLQLQITLNPSVFVVLDAMDKAFEDGWKACESHFDPQSEIGGAHLQMNADKNDWKNEEIK